MSAAPAIRWGRGAACCAPTFLLSAWLLFLLLVSLAAQDSTFILTTTDPTYHTPAFIGNGAFSLVGSPLGTTPSLSFAAGAYDHAADDVPRIAALPAWNALDVSDGDGWLNDTRPDTSALRGYRQTLALYDGTLSTSYEWVHGAKRTAVEVTTFVSRAEANLAVIRLRLVPQYAARITVVFPLREWPPPRRLARVASSRDGPDPLARARAVVRRAAARGYRTLAADHAAAWRHLWQTDVVVQGDAELQRVIHAMLFYLLASAREATDESIPPMGLSSAGYYGHVFWDADTWMLPPLLVLHPDLARSMVMFRYRALGAARRNASRNGYRGAMYPWESDEQGEETTPRFAWQNALYENHVTGDVALDQWLYIPFDSAGQYHPTYEGAPPETRGSVVPLLAYPLGLPMSERAKRNDLDAAVGLLLKQGSGAMMTTTLYPAIAAELGDRTLVDTLLPLSYRDHLRPPFDALAETPTNQAVHFLTGAGGFLQQIVFGWSGLRLGDEGLRPAFRPTLPSRITRLTLRHVSVRGRVVDIVVEGDSAR